MLPDFEAYCRLIADLPNQFPSIRSSTLSAYTIGPYTAEILGDVTFTEGYVLHVWESSPPARYFFRRLDGLETAIQ